MSGPRPVEETLEAAALGTLAPVASVPASPAPPERTGRFEYKWVALFVVLFGTIMTILDATIVNIALPTLQRDFGARSYNDIAWVVTGYLLAQGSVIPLAGWMTDRFGTKRIYLITLFLFTAASAACGLAPNLVTLIFFRLLQGVGGGMLMPVGMTIILRAVGPEQMGRVMGYFGVPMLLAPIAGPILGGWFVQDFTWRLIFYVNVPIGIVAMVAAHRLLRESPTSRDHRLDWTGLLTATPAVLAIMYAVDRSTVSGWGSPLVIGLLAAGAVLITAFVRHELHTGEPLLQLRLFRDPTFSWAMVLSLILVTSLFGAMLLLPLFLQQVHGYDALTTGLLLVPQAGAAAVLMPLGGYLTDRLGPRPVVFTGMLTMIASSILLSRLQPESPNTLLIAALLVRGGAMGLAMMPSMSAALARVPPQYISRASSITNTLQRVGSSLGIAVLVTVLSLQIGSSARQTACDPSAQVLATPQAHAIAGVRDLSSPVGAQAFCAAVQSRFASAAEQQSSSARRGSGSAVLDAFLKRYADSALSNAFDSTFVVIAVIAALGLVPVVFLRRPEKRAHQAAGEPALD